MGGVGAEITDRFQVAYFLKRMAPGTCGVVVVVPARSFAQPPLRLRVLHENAA
jgi:hypothetical protein